MYTDPPIKRVVIDRALEQHKENVKGRSVDHLLDRIAELNISHEHMYRDARLLQNLVSELLDQIE